MFVTKGLSLMRLAVAQKLSGQRLERTPEPTMLMEDADQVDSYHSAGQTTLDLIYCLAIEVIRVGLQVEGPVRALDLGCGSGNFAIRLADGLQLERVLGLDASQTMIELARRVAEQRVGGAHLEFVTGDIRKLGEFQNNAFSLTTCTLTGHHLTPDEVSDLLTQMDRLTSPEGLAFYLDLGRLKTRSLVERYVSIFSEGQSDRHNEDFLNSMLAAFTMDEMACMVPPSKAGSRWFHFSTPSVPTLQFIMRVPNSREPALNSPIWKSSPTQYAGDLHWRFLRNGVRNRCLRSWKTARVKHSDHV